MRALSFFVAIATLIYGASLVSGQRTFNVAHVHARIPQGGAACCVERSNLVGDDGLKGREEP